jgi:baculoviral IAP repeat-containing protein 7/8
VSVLGKGDRVICYQCGGGIKDWSEGDDPWTEHAAWFPNCPYLNLKKSSGFVQQVQIAKTQNQQANKVYKKVQIPFYV